jgi:DNA-binding transcriptional ArsR family regulator
MYSLHPTLWRTCRVLANAKRIELLYTLFQHPDLCVFELAEATGIRPEHASLHLRALSSRGLIRQTRRKMRLICRAEANNELDAPAALLRGLKECHSQGMTAEQVVRQSTAFTHSRRIEIMRVIPESGLSMDALQQQTHISYAALLRHLKKLERRGFVMIGRNLVQRATPPDPLSKALLQIILPAQRD